MKSKDQTVIGRKPTLAEQLTSAKLWRKTARSRVKDAEDQLNAANTDYAKAVEEVRSIESKIKKGG